MRVLFLLTSLLAQPAIAADKPISPTEFEALVTGKILSYSARSREYGVEQYFEGRRVRWAYLNGQCAEGRWYAAGDQICYVYDGLDTPQCWSYFLRGDQLLAQSSRQSAKSEKHEMTPLSEAPYCPAPDIGA